MLRRILLRLLFLIGLVGAIFCYQIVTEGAALYRHYQQARTEALARRAAARPSTQHAQPAQQGKQP